MSIITHVQKAVNSFVQQTVFIYFEIQIMILVQPAKHGMFTCSCKHNYFMLAQDKICGINI